ncbi:MAG: 50S ribosomal protein L1 [Betaproteobacteria bacterium]|jgi:large subunit ribosomal protein L1|nr:50S ribosomal protein L1 [Betaproteobacteria bacterium]
MSTMSKKKVLFRGFGKRMRASLEAKPKTALAPAEAVKALRAFKAPKFDQTVNVVVNLGIDPKAADQALRGSIAMPHGIGRSARVVCFCQSDKVAAAKAAGAIEAGGEELVAKIEGGWMEFDVAVASPDMMRVVSKLGKVLGPKGLMPSPKAGTVTPDVAAAVKEYGAGKQEYRNDDGGNIHCVIGKMSFKDEQLVANLSHFIATIEKARPASVKGTYLKKCVISAAMSPGVLVSA